MRLLAMAQVRGVELGMAFLDGTSIRATRRRQGRSENRPSGAAGCW
jgi:hypothetical protein